jgi:hypothetical protein
MLVKLEASEHNIDDGHWRVNGWKFIDVVSNPIEICPPAYTMNFSLQIQIGIDTEDIPSKINQLKNTSLRIQQQVLRLDVPMAHTLRVNVG